MLCAYLRDADQTDVSDLPAHGERYHAAVRLIAPTSAAKALRGHREITRDVVEDLADMKGQYFDGR